MSCDGILVHLWKTSLEMHLPGYLCDFTVICYLEPRGCVMRLVWICPHGWFRERPVMFSEGSLTLETIFLWPLPWLFKWLNRLSLLLSPCYLYVKLLWIVSVGSVWGGKEPQLLILIHYGNGKVGGLISLSGNAYVYIHTYVYTHMYTHICIHKCTHI